MRRAWVLALLAACATERADAPAPQPAPVEPSHRTNDLAEEVRRFVETRWSESVARSLEFPERVDAAVSRLEVEEEIEFHDTWRGCRSPHRFLSVVARRDTADVVLVACGYRWGVLYLCRDWPGKRKQVREPMGEEGVETRRGTISRAEFDRLVRMVALLQGATWHEAPGGALGEEEPSPFATGAFSVRLDRQPRIEPWGQHCSKSRFDEDGRAVLIEALIWSEAERWTLTEAQDEGAIGRALLRGLETDPISWRRPCRIMTLGYLGCEAAVPVLERLQPRGDEIDQALTQIRALRDCKVAQSAPPLLVELATVDPRSDSGWRLRFWAQALLAERFPADYRAWLRRRFEAGDLRERAAVLEELRTYDASDLTLARLARDDPDPGLRLEGAVLLDDRDLMLALARDATVPAELRVRAADHRADAWPLLEIARDASMLSPDRIRAIEAITRRPASRKRPDRQVVAEGLVLLLEDRSYDVRRAAAESIGTLRLDEATSALIRAMRAALSRREGGAAADFACALGELGAKDAIEPIDTALQGRTPSTFWYRACLGLARISDPRVLPILEREREKHSADQHALSNFDQSITIHKDVRRKDAESLLETGRDVSSELADRFTAAELRAFGRDMVTYRPVLERALELKEGRG